MQKNGFFNHNLTFFSSHFHTFFSFPIFHMAFCIISCLKKGFRVFKKRLFVFFPRMKIELPIFLLYNNHDTEVFP